MSIIVKRHSSIHSISDIAVKRNGSLYHAFKAMVKVGGKLYVVWEKAQEILGYVFTQGRPISVSGRMIRLNGQK